MKEPGGALSSFVLYSCAAHLILYENSAPISVSLCKKKKKLPKSRHRNQCVLRILSRGWYLSRYRAEPESKGITGSITGSVNFFLRTDDSHCDRIHSSLAGHHSFDDGHVRKKPVVWREYRAE